jgi:LAS superfamily LD-carboxypeptidase LdcB
MIVSNILFMLFLNSGGSAANDLSMKVTGYENGNVKPVYVSSILQKKGENSLFLSCIASDKFKEMMAHAAKDGFYLPVLSAFRTHREQHRMKRQRGNLAARPGWSKHQMGLSIDLGGTTRIIRGKRYRTILYWWMKRNAKRYGFYNDVETEPWHWTFYGDSPPPPVKKKVTEPPKEKSNNV